MSSIRHHLLIDTPVPDFLIVFAYPRGKGVAVQYDGPAEPVWQAANKSKTSNYTIAMSKLPAIAASAGPGLTQIRPCLQALNHRLNRPALA